MGIDLPPGPPSYSAPSNLSGFRPGMWQQDVFTVPIEFGLLGFINYYYTPRAHSLWPFNNQSGNELPRATQLPAQKLLPFVVGIPVGILGGLTLGNKDFPLYAESIGWLHAVLLTEIATDSAKTIFQEKRPDADVEARLGHSSDNDRASFFSGHASQAFSFATYSSALMVQFCPSRVLAWTYTAASYGVASWIAATRVQDHAHHIGDVVAGAFFGTLISGAVYYRVQQVLADQKSTSDSESSVKVDFSPSIWTDDFKRTWYTGTIQVNY